MLISPGGSGLAVAQRYIERVGQAGGLGSISSSPATKRRTGQSVKLFQRLQFRFNKHFKESSPLHFPQSSH